MQDVLQDLEAHRKLETLVLREIRQETLPLLAGIKSDSISKLSFSSHMNGYHLDFLPVIQSLRKTITNLSVEYAFAGSLHFQSPLVHTLSITPSWSPVTHALVQTFLNLLHFCLPTRFLGDGCPAARRLNNRSVLSSLTSKELWTFLRSFAGDLIGLYSLGLSCHAHELATTAVRRFVTRSYLDLLQDCRPRMTNLCTDVGSFSLRLLAGFSHDAFEQLNLSCTHLKLEFQLRNCEADIHAIIVRLSFRRYAAQSDILVRPLLASTMSELRVKPLEIEFSYVPKWHRCVVEYSDEEAGEAESKRPPVPIAEFLDAMDIKSFAQEVAQCVPTLVQIGISISHLRNFLTYWE